MCFSSAGLVCCFVSRRNQPLSVNCVPSCLGRNNRLGRVGLIDCSLTSGIHFQPAPKTAGSLETEEGGGGLMFMKFIEP